MQNQNNRKCEQCGTPIKRRRFCSRRCAFGGEFNIEYLYKTLATASTDPKSPCLEWPYALNKHGYGQVKPETEVLLVHRLAYEYVHGPLIGEECALHHCDNPKCFLPAHLFKGSKADNNADKIAKGRARNIPPPGSIKLTPEQVLDIRTRWIPRVNAGELASQYGISVAHIHRIITGNSQLSIGEYNNPHIPKTPLTKQQMSEIHKRFIPHSNADALAQEYGISAQRVRAIYRNKSYA